MTFSFVVVQIAQCATKYTRFDGNRGKISPRNFKFVDAKNTLCEFCEFVLYGMCGQTSTGGLNYVFQKFISDRLLLFQIRVLHQKQENELVSKNQKYYFRRQEVSN